MLAGEGTSAASRCVVVVDEDGGDDASSAESTRKAGKEHKENRTEQSVAASGQRATGYGFQTGGSGHQETKRGRGAKRR